MSLTAVPKWLEASGCRCSLFHCPQLQPALQRFPLHSEDKVLEDDILQSAPILRAPTVCWALSWELMVGQRTTQALANATEPHTLKWLILCYANFSSIKKLKINDKQACLQKKSQSDYTDGALRRACAFGEPSKAQGPPPGCWRAAVWGPHSRGTLWLVTTSASSVRWG